MSFLALATVLTAASFESVLINQTATLDDWRTGLGFLSPEPVSLAPKSRDRVSGHDTQGLGQDGLDLVITAVSPQALDALVASYGVVPISETVAIADRFTPIDSQDERIADITPDVQGTFSSLNQPDPMRSHQWALDQLGITPATIRGTAHQSIAVIDSGVWKGHPDLAGQVSESFYTGASRVEHTPPVNDQCRLGHGTFMAGITSAKASNGVGGRGIAPGARLIDIDAVDKAKCDKGPTLSSTITAIDLAADRGADAIVMSFGFRLGHCPLPLQQAIDRARAKGSVVVAAAGNQFLNPGRHLPETPASCDGAMSVGATHRGGEVATYSTRNRWVDLAAPGGRTYQGYMFGPTDSYVLTTNWPQAIGVPRSLYTGVAGTSFAAPEVAGAAVLLRQLRPDLTPDEIESILEHTASTPNQPTPAATVGWGEIHIPRALTLAQAYAPIPPKAFDLPYPVGLQSVRSSLGEPQPITRLATDAHGIDRAISISQATFVSVGEDPFRDRRGQAQWAVVSRADVHADALAGASLTLGVGPLLYTEPTLSPQTAAELTRVLPAESTVYLLGGEQAISKEVEEAIAALGFNPVRLGGSNRIETSTLIAAEVRHQVEQIGIDRVPASLVTASDAWADSIGAGYLGAVSGIPVVLSDADGLSEPTATATKDDHYVYVVGGPMRLSTKVERELGHDREAGSVIRLSGPDRYHTMVMVAARIERLRVAQQTAVAAMNFDDEFGWPTALAAAIPSAAFAQLPVAVSTARLDTDVATYVEGYGRPITIWGPEDHVSPPVATQLQRAVSMPYQAAGKP